MTRSLGCITLLLGLLCMSEAPATSPVADPFSHAQRNYLVACAGCHGFDGVSHSALVPNLKGLVGYYLYSPQGRAYLPRLPNVAFSALGDAEMAGVLNYLVFALNPDGAPRQAKPYDAVEVGKWRSQPLTEVNLSAYRRQLVETLIKEHRAPEALRDYSAPNTP